MATITVRFRGICCFIDPTNGATFKKRVVLPNSKGHAHAGMEKHLTIIEYYADELKQPPPVGMPVESYSRPGDDGKYQRIELDAPMHIEFLGTSPGDVVPGPNLEDLLIRLDSLVDEKNVLKRTLLGPAMEVDPNLVMAVMDLPKGMLMAGPPEASRTRFPTRPDFGNRRIARWLELITEVRGEFGLRLTPLAGSDGVAKEIRFDSSTRLVTIANEPLRLITAQFVRRPNRAEKVPPAHDDKHDAPTAGTPAAMEATVDATAAMGISAHTATSAHGAAPAPITTPMPMDRQPLTTGHFELYWDLMADPSARPIPEASQGIGPGCAPANKP